MRKVKKSKSKIIRAVLKFCGILFVCLAFLGIVFPVIPTTPFLLMAAWCFMKSSERLYRWMMTNRIFGKYLKNYIEGKGVPLFIKIFVLTLLWLMIGYLIVFVFEDIFFRL